MCACVRDWDTQEDVVQYCYVMQRRRFGVYDLKSSWKVWTDGRVCCKYSRDRGKGAVLRACVCVNLYVLNYKSEGGSIDGNLVFIVSFYSLLSAQSGTAEACEWQVSVLGFGFWAIIYLKLSLYSSHVCIFLCIFFLHQETPLGLRHKSCKYIRAAGVQRCGFSLAIRTAKGKQIGAPNWLNCYDMETFAHSGWTTHTKTRII